MTSLPLTGLKEAVNGRHNLQRIYKKLIRILKKLPEDASYRIYTEQIICHRLSVVNAVEDEKEIERIICCGRIEMLMKQAYLEYELCQKMMLWKPWETLTQDPPPSQWKWPTCMR